MAGIRYWVWLSALRGLSARGSAALLREFQDPMEIYFAEAPALEGIEGLEEKDREALRDKSLRETERILASCEEQNIRILTLQDADYPARLREIHDPPAVLYLRGRLPYLDESPAIALVGTRRASPYGEKMARNLGWQITAGGGIVITGMALGIDGAAARGALMAGGRCVGVLGSAIDVNYPRQHESLIEDVAAVGCILSEYPPGTKTMNFPRRNRIISGLASGVCVVEAPKKSGALITAGLALEQGRDLFAVPGNADNPGCEGSNALIRDCARLVSGGADILEEYAGLYTVQAERAAAERPYESPQREIDKEETIAYIDLDSRLQGCTDEQQALLRLLSTGEKDVDELIESSGMGAPKVLAELTFLSIRGLVQSAPGRRYSLK